jgi:hypothetical protein
MTEVGTGGGSWVGFVNWAARAVFYDDPKYFCKGDDIANAPLGVVAGVQVPRGG